MPELRRAPLVAWAAVAMVLATAPARALERVTWKHEGRERSVAGRLLVTDRHGALLVEGPDSRLWTIPAAEITARRTTDEPFEFLAADALATQLLAELPPDFEVHRTAHYLVCFNTSRAYAEWCGALFERLYLAFTNYWTQRGFELTEPEYPLVALVFADRVSYAAYAAPELGESTRDVIGYYSLDTNRITMYDLTGFGRAGAGGDRRAAAARINQLLAQPQAERTVATIVHEATHQIAFNCGLHARLADVPLWLSEGLAIYFETPDLKSSSGWRSIGATNRVRLAQFRDYLKRRPRDALQTLLADDQRLRTPATAHDAYAEAWALTYFLIRQKPDEFRQYLRRMGEKEPWLRDDPATRQAEFLECFGGPLETLDAQFLRYLQTVR